MSGYHQIFMQVRGDESEALRDVEASSGVDMRKVSPISEAVTYGGRSGESVVEVEIGHDIENDRGMEFERYPVVVTVRDVDSDKEREATTAFGLFRRLRELRDYPMLLVFDLQELLAEN